MNTKEIIIKFEKSKISGKKYTAYVKDKKTLENIGKKGQKTIELILDGSLLNHEELLLKQVKKWEKN